jgi:aspartyl-tRNA(Asn)/glutamyl-tRNA(Gln) amidotransferase subunit B
MRSKEDAHDYRYFPDPDLLPLFVSKEWIERERASLPELPAAKRQRFVRDYGLSAYDSAILTASLEMADYFEAAVRACVPAAAKLCANWVMVDLAARLNREDKELSEAGVSAAQLGGLVLRIADGTISNAIGKKIFEALWAGEGSNADEIIEKQGLKQISDDGTLEKLVDDVLSTNPVSVAEYRAGKEKAFNALVGQAMKAAKGKANPQKVSELLRQKLSNL